MPNFGFTTGLAQLPAAHNDKDFALVRPLYQAINSVAQQLSVEAGAVVFTQSELSQRNQFGSLLAQNHRKLWVQNVSGAILAYGKVVTLGLTAGKITAIYADSTNNTKPAHGVVNNSAGILNGEYGEIMLIEGLSHGIAGTTIGLYYYLSTNGDVQAGRPAAAGTIIQACGIGFGSAGFYLHISSLFIQN